jgi:hypothetical protein
MMLSASATVKKNYRNICVKPGKILRLFFGGYTLKRVWNGVPPFFCLNKNAGYKPAF